MRKKKILKKVVTLTLTLALAAGLSACGKATSKTGSKDSGEKVLNVGVVTLADQPFDPAQASLAYLEQTEPIFDTLLHVDKDGNYTPGLAESWEFSDDYKTFTIKLRKGVKFHDGSELTSEDVKFTLEHYAAEESNQADKIYLNLYLDKIETLDQYTAVVKFKSAFTEFEYLISEGGTGTGIILPKAYFEKVGEEEFNKNPIGAGPFKFESFKAGEEAVFTAYADYWQGKSKIDKLVIKQVAEENTRISGLQSGEYDFAPISSNSVSVIESANGVSVQKVDYISAVGIFISGAYDNTGAATQNEKIREALYTSIDRQEIVNAIFNGDAKESPVWGVFPFTSGYDGSRENAKFDVKNAKKLVQEAGYPDSFSNPTIKLYTTDDNTYNKELAQTLASYWKNIGLQVEIVTIDPVTLEEKYGKKPLDKDFEGALYIFDAPKKYSIYDATSPFYPTKSFFGLVQGDKTLDENVEKLLTLYGKDRSPVTNIILDELEKSHVSIPLVYPSQNYAVSDKVKSWDSDYSAHWGNWFYKFELN